MDCSQGSMAEERDIINYTVGPLQIGHILWVHLCTWTICMLKLLEISYLDPLSGSYSVIMVCDTSRLWIASSLHMWISNVHK